MNKLAKLIAQDRNIVAKLSKKTGISKPALYNWAREGRIPKVTLAVKLEKATKGFVSVYSWGK